MTITCTSVFQRAIEWVDNAYMYYYTFRNDANY